MRGYEAQAHTALISSILASDLKKPVAKLIEASRSCRDEVVLESQSLCGTTDVRGRWSYRKGSLRCVDGAYRNRCGSRIHTPPCFSYVGRIPTTSCLELVIARVYRQIATALVQRREGRGSASAPAPRISHITILSPPVDCCEANKHSFRNPQAYLIS